MTTNMPFSQQVVYYQYVVTVYLLCGVVRLSHCSVVSPGVGVITAPVNVTARFNEPLTVPGRVTIKFWGGTKHQGPSPSTQKLSFHMEQRGGHICHMMGLISRS